MRVSYCSFGADSEGEYEVVIEGNKPPRSSLEAILPVPAYQVDGKISLSEVGDMIISELCDDGCLEIIEPPTKELQITMRGYIITIPRNGDWVAVPDPVFAAKRREATKQRLAAWGK